MALSQLPIFPLSSSRPTICNPFLVEMRGSLSLAAGVFTLLGSVLAFPQPEQIYGVNLGSWYLSEFRVLHRLVTILTQVFGRTLDAPRGCVIGKLHSPPTP